MKRQICNSYKGKISQNDLYNCLSLSKSSRYYKSSNNKRGAKPSMLTRKTDGTVSDNKEVIGTLINDVFGQEFNRYGYRLSNEELKAMGFIINHKKTYRLMKENGLLLEKINRIKQKKRWVKFRKIEGACPLEHLCMDIKYVYVHGAKRNAYLLVIMDIATRYVLGWSLGFSMKHTDVILCLHQVLQGYQCKGIFLRTDNGSQFIAHGLRKFCIEREITQEFTHIATPEENSYVESLFSCVNREVICSYEFSSIYHAKEVFKRYFEYHNVKRRRHSLGRKSPLNFWNFMFPNHPVKQQRVLSGGSDKGDDTFKNNNSVSSFIIPLSDPERGLSLLNKDDDSYVDVLNIFKKNVQLIGG